MSDATLPLGPAFGELELDADPPRFDLAAVFFFDFDADFLLVVLEFFFVFVLLDFFPLLAEVFFALVFLLVFFLDDLADDFFFFARDFLAVVRFAVFLVFVLRAAPFFPFFLARTAEARVPLVLRDRPDDFFLRVVFFLLVFFLDVATAGSLPRRGLHKSMITNGLYHELGPDSGHHRNCIGLRQYIDLRRGHVEPIVEAARSAS